jgi:two-component system cell cycle response regulator
MRTFARSTRAPVRAALARRRLSRAELGILALVAGLVLLAAHTVLGLGGSQTLFDWLFDAVMVGGGLVCIWRAAASREERLAWALIGAGLLVWCAGSVYSDVAGTDLGNPPSFSVADILYLSYYPLVCAGLVQLLRRSTHDVPRAVWIDGLIGAAVTAAIATQFVLGPALDRLGGDVFGNVSTLVYPLGDTILLAFVAAALVVTGWRPGRTWGLLLLGLGLAAAADAIYSYQSVSSSFSPGTTLDALWPAAAVLAAWAACRPMVRPRDRATQGWLVVAAPAAFAAAALSLRGYQHIFGGVQLAEFLAWTALGLVVLRLIASLIENQHLLELTRSDELTGLGNRLRLELDFGAPGLDAPERRRLTLFDLDGFKIYNETFGHPAGDLLLARLARRLAVSARNAGGQAYRVGGDEFCALLPLAAGDHSIDACASALSDRGEGFDIGASFGSARIPEEATTLSAALQICDQRMYQQKDFRRVSAGGQAKAVLLRALFERQPEVREHTVLMRELAVGVGEELNLSSTELSTLAQAAELHDIGKVAIPEAILSKPGSLDEHEWELMRQHTILGSRILSSAPALAPVARIVRATHERWDGSGYPDGLVGERIPLAARIIAACDAFHAITGKRPYRQQQSDADALAELQRYSGKQFDPKVVQAFTRMLIANPELAAHAFAYHSEDKRNLIAIGS